VTAPNLLPAAEAEVVEAMDWYEDRSAGLGLEFVAALQAAFQTIGESPERCPVWMVNRRYRRVILRRFPYALFFHLREAGPEIVAVAHCSRRPGYWLSRVDPEP
jgi:plasmid stabilization system protein ParE